MDKQITKRVAGTGKNQNTKFAETKSRKQNQWVFKEKNETKGERKEHSIKTVEMKKGYG
jgi:hypothetical protein